MRKIKDCFEEIENSNPLILNYLRFDNIFEGFIGLAVFLVFDQGFEVDKLKFWGESLQRLQILDGVMSSTLFGLKSRFLDHFMQEVFVILLFFAGISNKLSHLHPNIDVRIFELGKNMFKVLLVLRNSRAQQKYAKLLVSKLISLFEFGEVSFKVMTIVGEI